MRPYAYVILCISMAILAGCDSNDNANGNANGNASEAASPSASIEASANAPSTSAPSQSESPASSITELYPSPSAPSPSPEDPIRRYIDAIPGDHADEVVVFSAEADLELDGEAETVVALGRDGEVTAFYVLRDVGGDVMRIGDNMADDEYMSIEAKLIQLQDYSKPILYTELTNGSALYGFRLFEMNGGKPTELLYSASMTGVGDDRLIDSDGDGRYDGYSQHRYSYDELYYNVQRWFAWNAAKGEFELQDTFLALDESYPDDVESVVYQYLSLNVINDGYSEELTARLNELCSDPDAHGLSIDWELWRIALFDAVMEVGGSYSLEVEENGDHATALAVARADNKSAAISFHLTKMHDQWTITKIG